MFVYTVVTQTYQINTKHTQHRNTFIIYMITLIHDSRHDSDCNPVWLIQTGVQSLKVISHRVS